MRPVSPRTFLLATAGVLCLAASLLSPPILSNFLLHFGTIRPSAFVATLWGVCASFVLCAGVLVLVAQDAADAENLLQWARHRFLAIVSVGVVGVLLSLAVVAWIALAVDIASRAVLLGLFVFGLLFLATGILLVGLPRSPFLCAFSLSTTLRALLYTAILSGSGLLTAKLVTTGYNAARNHVDIIADLDRRHPLYQEVQNVRSSQGLDAARAHLVDYFQNRTSPNTDESFLGPPSAGVNDRADRFLGGDLSSAGEEMSVPWRPGQRIRWGDEALDSLLFLLQGHRVLFDVLRSDVHGNDPHALEVAAAFVEEWQRSNSNFFNPHVYSWNDHAMSDRIVAQGLLMEARRSLGLTTPGEELRFLRSMLQHADRLMNENEHNYRTNHGMIQNSALLYLATAYPEYDHEQRWQQTAIERTRRFLNNLVSSEGVSLEVTPSYHWLITIEVLNFVTVCKNNNIQLPNEMEDTVRKMLRFCLEILHPDYSVPRIADSVESLDFESFSWEWFFDFPELAELKRRVLDRSTPPNEPTARYWPRAGYFVLRTAPEPDAASPSLMLTLVAGEKSRAHNHHNALALTLFAHGRPILVGPGYPGYQDLQLRNVLIGTPSQTTVSVDGGSHRLGDTSLLFLQREFRDIPGGKIPAQVALQAESTLYEGVTHRRSLFYGPSPQSVLLIDELTSAEEHRYQQQFRIEENLHGRTERGRVTVFPAGDNPQPLLVIHNSLITDDAVGETQARMSGTVAGFPAYERNVVFLSLLDYSGSEDIANDALRITPDRVTWKGSLGELDLSLPVSPADVRWSVDMANAAH